MVFKEAEYAEVRDYANPEDRLAFASTVSSTQCHTSEEINRATDRYQTEITPVPPTVKESAGEQKPEIPGSSRSPLDRPENDQDDREKKSEIN